MTQKQYEKLTSQEHIILAYFICQMNLDVVEIDYNKVYKITKKVDWTANIGTRNSQILKLIKQNG